jgi:hypothetical protein
MPTFALETWMWTQRVFLGHRRLQHLAVALGLGACNDSVPITTAFCGGFGEAKAEFASTPSGYAPTVFVVEPGLAPRMSALIAASVRQMITGDSDGDGRQDEWAYPKAQIAIVSTSDLFPLLSSLDCTPAPGLPCPPTKLANALYQYAPYGYADDVDAFLDAVDCLAANLDHAGDACTSQFIRRETEDLRYANVVIITDRDLCDATDPACKDEPMRKLVSGFPRVDLVVAVPADLLDDASYEQLQPSDYYARILGDPRMAKGAGPLSCGDVSAEPARNFVSVFSHDDSSFGALLSLCSTTAKALVDRDEDMCGAYVDAVRLNIFSDTRIEADGRAACKVLETLPPTGRITHCAQLSDHGRSLDSIRADGRETCSWTQISPDAAMRGPQEGFYLVNGPWTHPAPDQRTREDFTPPCYGIADSPGPHLEYTPGTPFIAGSTRIIDCVLDHGGRCQ